jgi:hypothetical protein
MLYMLEPEVAGELGEKTEFQNYDDVRLKGERPIVTKLNYSFTGWLGDELLEATPCFIVTEALAKAIEKNSLSGYRFEKVLISFSDEFKEIYPDKKMPIFKRLIPTGKVIIENGLCKEWSGDDICASQNSYIVVNSKALSIIRDHNIENCDITELK